MTRIIAGSLAGRRLDVPASARPTTDRVREAVFSSVGHEIGVWEGLAVLDLFAGSGALGLEALSRGADQADFVEQDRAAVAVLRRNLATLGLTDRGRVVAADAIRWRPSRDYDVVLIDPPYTMAAETIAGVVAGLVAAGGLAPGALIVAERPSRETATPFPVAVDLLRRRRYGETTVWYGRAESDPR